jgi:hypothetical protein
LAPFPGDPASETYDDCLPDFNWPIIFGLGLVSGIATESANRQIEFPVTMTEYVRGLAQQSTIL